jgi:hypothetical protein
MPLLTLQLDWVYYQHHGWSKLLPFQAKHLSDVLGCCLPADW